MSKKQPAIAECKGELYCKAKHSGIHHLVILIDALPITFFGKSKEPWIKLSQVRDWHLKEIDESHGRSGSRAVADACSKILGDYAKEKTSEQPQEGV